MTQQQKDDYIRSLEAKAKTGSIEIQTYLESIIIPEARNLAVSVKVDASINTGTNEQVIKLAKEKHWLILNDYYINTKNLLFTYVSTPTSQGSISLVLSNNFSVRINVLNKQSGVDLTITQKTTITKFLNDLNRLVIDIEEGESIVKMLAVPTEFKVIIDGSLTSNREEITGNIHSTK